jgi:protein-S-isoprenylcysteine O-methyltransferase Ste14
MYPAVILSTLCLPLFLGSFYALIPAALVAALYVLRTSLEDRTLREELPGYADYARKTRWKLVPNVWRNRPPEGGSPPPGIRLTPSCRLV